MVHMTRDLRGKRSKNTSLDWWLCPLEPTTICTSVALPLAVQASEALPYPQDIGLHTGPCPILYIKLPLVLLSKHRATGGWVLA